MRIWRQTQMNEENGRQSFEFLNTPPSDAVVRGRSISRINYIFPRGRENIGFNFCPRTPVKIFRKRVISILYFIIHYFERKFSTRELNWTTLEYKIRISLNVPVRYRDKRMIFDFLNKYTKYTTRNFVLFLENFHFHVFAKRMR